MEFLGYELSGHIVAASCPSTESLENVLQCEKNGAAAVILKTASSHRVGDKKTRRCYIDDTGLWAESGFDREILPLKDGAALTRSCVSGVMIPVISSVTELTLDVETWLESCKSLEEAGASALQLDLFYIEDLLKADDFTVRFINLLKEIVAHSGIPVMPKLNIGLPSSYSAYLLKESGMHYVSLLDSIRSPAPIGADNLTDTNLSVFGSFMLPITRQYTYAMVKTGLSVCAGGGIRNGHDAFDLLNLGAAVTQIATEVLLNGYKRFVEINSEIDLGRSMTKSKAYPRTHIQFVPSKCVGCGACTTQTFCPLPKRYREGPFQCEKCGLCVEMCRYGALRWR